MNNNIDDIFKNAARNYSAPAPSNSWGKLDAALKSQQKAIFIRKFYIAASVIFISGLALFFAFNNDDAKQCAIVENGKIEKQNTINIVQNENNDIVKNSNQISSNSIVDNKVVEKTASLSSENTLVINDDINSIDVVKPISSVNTLEEKEDIKDKDIISPKKEIIANNSDKKIVANISVENINVETITTNEIDSQEGVALNEKKAKGESAEVIANIDKKHQKILVEEENAATENVTIEVAEAVAKVEENSTTNNNISEKETPNATENSESVVINDITDSNVEAKNITEKHKIKKDKPKADLRFFIGQTYGITYTNAISRDAVINDPKLSIANNNSGDIWISASVDLGVEKGNFIFRSGVRLYNHEVCGDFEIKEKNPYKVNLENFGISSLGYIRILNINTNVRLGNPQSAIYIQDFNRYNISVRYVDIPLVVAYKFKYKKFSFIPHIGLNTTFLLSNDIMLESDKGYYMHGEIKEMKDYMIGISSGAGAYVNLGKHWMLGLDADFVYYPGSISSNPEFNYHPYSFIMGPSAVFKL